MKGRFPLCYLSSILACIAYPAFTTVAYMKYPEVFSPQTNWLSDLGNLEVSPIGGPYYNIGVVIAAICTALWFLGLGKWKLQTPPVQARLLRIAQSAGVLAAIGLFLSALYPINLATIHALWSKVHFIASGVGFAFAVTALRYHPRFSKGLMATGAFASVMPFLIYVSGETYWLEWAAVGVFLVFITWVGVATKRLTAQTVA